ncbi:HisKA [Geranomyces variabilis]|nr:HisKA [Geranomyces variabilis]
MRPSLVVTAPSASRNNHHHTPPEVPPAAGPTSAAARATTGRGGNGGSNQKVSWKAGVTWRQVVQWFKQLHIANSAPSVSRSNSESETSYTGPVRRNGDTLTRGAGGQRTAGGAGGGGGMDSDDEFDDADEIIVEGDTTQAVSSIGSRHHSIDGNSVASMSQTVTTQDVDGTLSDFSHASAAGRWYWFGSYVRNAKAINRIKAYFNQKFLDENIERIYQKETWWLRKPLALLAAFYIVLSWILVIALVPRPWSVYNYWSYLGLNGFFSLALPIAVIADVPRHSTGRWQLQLCITTLMWPVILAIELRVCGFYRNFPGYFGGGDCGNKDFQTMMFYAASFQVIALFALKQTRLWACITTIVYVIVYSITVLPDRIFSIRNIFVYFMFGVFLNYMNYNQERLDRKIFLMRDELKRQFKATQRARHLEFKAGDSKKRFVSYIFHEVRVPLNAASLAVQNLEAEGLFETCSQDQRDVVDALRGSLGMMAKVLNDVLDFNRMEEGKLVVTHNSLELHKVIRSLLVSARVVAQTRSIAICMRLDPKIDKLQRKKLLVGDEMRLRQVLSNLVSNASKFTNPGGTVTVVTQLLDPHMYGISSTSTTPSGSQSNINGGNYDMLQINVDDPNPARCVIRLEVQDTGVGIRRQDLVNNRLFSPYVQTDEGRRQGGKGTGLGLALVRHIVKLSGGRLGVKSSRGVGSTFWVELPFELKDEERTPSVEYYPGNDDGQYADESVAGAGGEQVMPSHMHDPIKRAQSSAFNSLNRDGAAGGGSTPPTGAVGANGKPKKKVQIADDDSSDDMSISDISVPSYPRTEANAEALRETLKDFGRVFSSGTKEASSSIPLHALKDRNGFIVDPLSATTSSSPLSRPPVVAAPDSSPSISPTSAIPSTIDPLGTAEFPFPESTAPPSALRSQPNTSPNNTALSLSTTVHPLALSSAPTSLSHPPSPSTPIPCTPPTPSCPPPQLKAHVLIVDDDKITRLLMSRLISRMGHTIATAEDGAIALQKLTDALRDAKMAQNPTVGQKTLFHTQSAPGMLNSGDGGSRRNGSVPEVLVGPLGPMAGAPEARPFDVVFLDNQMPVMTGVECIREIRRRDIPVWACGVTGNAMIEDQDEFYEAGIDRVLTKPVVEADVKAMIAMAMAQSEPDYFGRETWRKVINTPVESESGSR